MIQLTCSKEEATLTLKVEDDFGTEIQDAIDTAIDEGASTEVDLGYGQVLTVEYVED